MIRESAYRHARSYLGVTEHPPGSNLGPQVEKWQREATGTVGYPWCAAFMFSMFVDAGDRLGMKYPASVSSWVEWAQAHGMIVQRPLRWDVVAYSWHGDTPVPGDHIGIVERVLALPWKRNGKRYRIRTIEGNTGDGVYRRWRWVDPGSVAFIRVPG